MPNIENGECFTHLFWTICQLFVQLSTHIHWKGVFCVNHWKFYPSPKFVYMKAARDPRDKFHVWSWHIRCHWHWNWHLMWSISGEFGKMFTIHDKLKISNHDTDETNWHTDSDTGQHLWFLRSFFILSILLSKDVPKIERSFSWWCYT